MVKVGVQCLPFRLRSFLTTLYRSQRVGTAPWSGASVQRVSPRTDSRSGDGILLPRLYYYTSTTTLARQYSLNRNEKYKRNETKQTEKYLCRWTPQTLGFPSPGSPPSVLNCLGYSRLDLRTTSLIGKLSLWLMEEDWLTFRFSTNLYLFHST